MGLEMRRRRRGEAKALNSYLRTHVLNNRAYRLGIRKSLPGLSELIITVVEYYERVTGLEVPRSMQVSPELSTRAKEAFNLLPTLVANIGSAQTGNPIASRI